MTKEQQTLGIGTANIGPDTNVEALDHIIRMLHGNTRAIGVTEMGGRDRLVELLRAEFLNVVYSTEPNQGRVALVLEPTLVPEKVEWVQVNEKKKVGAPGAGPPVAPDRWMACVKVYDLLTRRRYWILVKHMIASQSIHVRDVEAEKDVAATVEWIKAHKRLAVFVVGDLNNPPGHPNFAPLRDLPLEEAGIALRESLPTMGNRHIDHVWYRAKSWLTPLSQRLFPLNKDDHDGYIAVFYVTPRSKVAAKIAGLFKA